MITPKEWKNNIKKRIITDVMLDTAIYSVNKRAKNYRDAKREQWGKYRDISANKQSEMYDRKSALLSILKPTCIHEELIGYEKTRVFSYQDKYETLLLQMARENRVIWTNSYLDYDSYQSVYFFDYINPDKPIINFYLFYELGTHSYHQPINNPKKYPDLTVNKIGTLDTHGSDALELCSVQFVDKIIELINSKDYTYVQTPNFTIPQLYENHTKQFNECSILSNEILAEYSYVFLDKVRNIEKNSATENISKYTYSDFDFDKESIESEISEKFKSVQDAIEVVSEKNYLTKRNFYVPKPQVHYISNHSDSQIIDFFLNSKNTSIKKAAKSFFLQYPIQDPSESEIIEYLKNKYARDYFVKLLEENNIISIDEKKLKKKKIVIAKKNSKRKKKSEHNTQGS